MSIQRHCFPDHQQASKACAHHVMAVLEDALAGRPYATLALSGGVTPKTLFENLAASVFPWDRVHFFWVDERLVSPTDPASNYGMAERWFLKPARVPRKNIHRIFGELQPETAAKRYCDDIREFFGLAPGEMPHFDLIHRGIGPDAHTASLFPGERLLENREDIAAAVLVDQLSQWRVTMLPGVLLAAQRTVFLVTGNEKAQAVRAIFQEPYDPMKYPAQMTSHHGRKVAWFMDESAASFMDQI